MEFEYDETKSDSNFTKHGIDFKSAQQLWDDPSAIIIPAKTVGESRYLLVAKIADQLWSAIFTFRNKRIRIISVRRARKNEEEFYKN